MLDGAPIEGPFSILSASIEHPLGAGGNRVESGTRMEFLSHKGTITSGNVAKWAGGKQKSEARVRLG